ncbi:MAG: protein-L-isoaspartate(D-aspartate) O-methyltransferase [Thermoguttaceae bacterium]|nr:protein-L-isoaspartate(D-aspartate) O-methyltransferase [Thermoguttaceae bacterium]MDW8038478.1 protein-L-isoaspartate(D-aspartate) O-methyltransferase [Thermoguttaceae bacterium]
MTSPGIRRKRFQPSVRATDLARRQSRFWSRVLLGGLAVLGWHWAAVGCGQSRFDQARERMVQEAIIGAGIKNPRVIEAMRTTPRHEFVPLNQRQYAYLDMALPIGEGQTISPPFIVAYMTEQLDPQPTDRVLEIGTGSGYQAAVLSPLVKEVYTIEIIESLARRAAQTLKRLKYDNVFVKAGDGYLGWPEKAPFDKIIVTCSPEKVPPPLVEQLREGGRMIIPLGQRYQQIFYLLKKENGQLVQEALKPALFVPMTGQAEKLRTVQPDPAKPAIVNGDFEQATGDPPEPVGWHYLRQVTWQQDTKAPSGQHYIRFSNSHPGRPAQALQGFAVDGRKVSSLEVSVWVRGEEIRPGPNGELPALVILFYDEKRQPAGEALLGPWRGSFDWQQERRQMPVPQRAREAILRIGLFGAVGELSVDHLRLQGTEK